MEGWTEKRELISVVGIRLVILMKMVEICYWGDGDYQYKEIWHGSIVI